MAREVELKCILQQNAEESTISFLSTLAMFSFKYKGFRSISLPAISNLAPSKWARFYAILYLVSIFKLDILSLVVHVFCRIKGGDKKKSATYLKVLISS